MNTPKRYSCLNVSWVLITGKPTEWRGDVGDISIIVGKHHQLRKTLPNGGRLIKTHETFRREYPKAVFIVRDGRDAAVSEFHYQRTRSPLFPEYKNDFCVFFDRFLKGTVNGYGAWHKHTLSWLQCDLHRSDKMLLVRFEDLKSSPLRELKRIVQFLNLEASEQRLQDAIDDMSLESMRKKEREYWESRGIENKNFVRHGKAGNWRDVLSPEQVDRFWTVAGDAMRLAGYERE